MPDRKLQLMEIQQYQHALLMAQQQPWQPMNQLNQQHQAQRRQAEVWKDNKKRKYLGLAHQCSKCERSFSTQEGLDAHLADRHQVLTPSSAEAKIAHPDAADQTGKVDNKSKPFVCVHCAKSFAKEQSLLDHTRASHPQAGDQPTTECKSYGAYRSMTAFAGMHLP